MKKKEKKKDISKMVTFTIKINSLDEYQVNFSLLAGKGFNTGPNEGSGLISLLYDEFTAFVIRLVAYVYCKGKLTAKEKKLLGKIPVMIFDGPDAENSQPINAIILRTKKRG
jgi:hypothetical protein